MKKILILTCTIILVLATASCALAEGAISIELTPSGFDYIGSGEKNGNDDYKSELKQSGDLEAYSLSLEGTIDDFKYGIEFGTGKDGFKSGDILTSARTYDYHMEEYKFGARIFNFEHLKMDVTASRLEILFKDNVRQVDMSGNLLGFDVNCIITEKFSAQAYLGYSLFGSDYKETASNIDDSYMAAAKVKLNYKVSSHLAFSLGFKGVGLAAYDKSTDPEKSLIRGVGGFFTGLTCIF
jgi:hypothetical protein